MELTKERPTKERVRELLEMGVTPKKIAEKLGIKPATVYTYRHIFKKEANGDEKKQAKKVDHNEEYKKLYEDLKSEYEKLDKINDDHLLMLDRNRRELTKLQKVNGKISDELSQLQEKHKKLTDKHIELSEKVSEEVSTNNPEIHALQKIIKELNKENEMLKKRNDELIDEAREEIARLKEQYEQEKAKHKTLFRYITLEKEVI